MALISEFKKFAMRGNVMDMAVGVIIGAAFGKIVTSFVSDVLMPPIGVLLGKVDFSNLFVNLSDTPVESVAQAQELGIPVISYGLFINTVIDFLIQAFVIFMMIRQMNRLMPKHEEPAGPEQKDCPHCWSKIDKRATRCPHCGGEMKVEDAA